jgi:uncharacterized protein YbjT (DUF2867 family)
MTNETFFITGGTGRTGRRVVERLSRLGHSVRVASRRGTPSFDWDDEGTWAAHLDGVSAVYLCYSPDLAFPGAGQILSTFAEAAAALGVRRAVLLSGRGEDGAAQAERLVLSSGLETTVVRCAWFAQNFSEHFLLGSVRRGRLALPAGKVREPFVDLEDVADVAVHALTRGGYAGQVLELTGPESLTFDETASTLAQAAGRPVRYEDVRPAEFIADMVTEGMPAEEAEVLTWLFAEILDGRNEATTDTIATVLGRPAGSFADYARRTAVTGVWDS